MRCSVKVWTFAAVLFLACSVTAQPTADYGDAPDGTDAYPGVVGRFPTLFANDGSRTLTVGQEMIGEGVSAETDANDPADPDGVRNLVDTDNDDKVYILIMIDGVPASAQMSFPATISQSAPSGKRYINVLLDFDKNGSWGGERNGREWAVKNMEVEIPPGNTQWVRTPKFFWGGGMLMPTPVWGRVSITREPIDVNDWDGSGEFAYGEIQDFEVRLGNWSSSQKEKPKPKPPVNKTKPVCGNNKREPGEQCDGKDDAACPGKCKPDCTCPKGGGPGGPGKPGPDKGPCGTPVSYFALVINAGDYKGQQAAQEAADNMWSVLAEQGYDGITYLGPKGDPLVDGTSNLAGIEKAIEDIKSKIKCVDRLFVFIIGHGAEKNGKLYGQKWPSGGINLKSDKEVLTPEKLNELLGEIPTCPNEDCKTPSKTCHMQIAIESCHSGNFFDALKALGRTVVVSSTSAQVSYAGTDANGNPSGGDYSNGYIKDLRDPSNADTSNPPDGIVSVAEAHASATAKLNPPKGKKQTPNIDSQECECLPLTCGPKCGDGSIDPDEECDYNATPTGCSQSQECNEDCECEGGITPEPYCGDGTIQATEQCDPQASPTGCEQGQSCIDCECISDYVPPVCPSGQYATQDECESKKKSHHVCVLNEQNHCWALMGICNKGEYVSSDCNGDCDDDEECIVVDSDVPCYGCGTLECGEGEYQTQQECEAECEDDCGINEATNCWYCGGEITCEQLGMYSGQSDCGADCQEPDYCAFHEGYGCWYCRHVTVTCSGSLYEDSDCDGDCPGHCGKYQGGPCYKCICPDLYVSSLSASISRSRSTTCQGESCKTVCTLTADANFRIKNAGDATAGASTALVQITPDVGSKQEPMESLSSKQESSTKSVNFQKSQEVIGRAEACLELGWWVSSYTVSVTADYGNAVDECDKENNNVQSGTVTPQS
jgi:hypothetical protein